jgi:hypothetical protein
MIVQGLDGEFLRDGLSDDLEESARRRGSTACAAYLCRDGLTQADL